MLINTGYCDDSDARSALVATIATSSESSANYTSMNNTTTGSGWNGNGRILSPPPAIASINDELPLLNVGRAAGAAAATAADSSSVCPVQGGGSNAGSRIYRGMIVR